MTRLHSLAITVGLLSAAMFAPMAYSQTTGRYATSVQPAEGLRSSAAAPRLLEGGQVVTAPGADPIDADVLIDGTTIVAVGRPLRVPDGTERIDVSGRRIYAGLIDAMHDVDVPEKTAPQVAKHWNGNVTPRNRAVHVANQTHDGIEKLRKQGIAAQLLAPKGGIFKGTSCLVALVDPDDAQRLIVADVFHHATLTKPRGQSRDRYPNSPMGATALLRQTFYDAQWYQDAMRTYQIDPGLSRPDPSDDLQQIADMMHSGTVVIDAANERMALRAGNVADEFSLNMILRGSGREYRAIDEIKSMGRMILVPVDFPDAPSTATVDKVRNTPLVDWMHWHLAPENPARLAQAGVPFCLTTDGLDNVDDFIKQVRVAVERGLDPTVAHAALTTTPAKWLGVDDSLGRVEAGMLASLVITRGDLFDTETKLVETWVAGQRFEFDADSSRPDDPLIGQWEIGLTTSDGPVQATVEFVKKKKGIEATLRLANPPSDAAKDKQAADKQAKDKEAEPVESEDVESDDNDSDSKESGDAESDDAESDDAPAADQPRSVKLTDLIRQRGRLSGKAKLHALDDRFAEGISTFTLLTVETTRDDDIDVKVLATWTPPSGDTQGIAIRSVQPKSSHSQSSPSDDSTVTSTADETKKDAPPEPADDADSQSDASKPDAPKSVAADSNAAQPDTDLPIDVVYPLGAYGLAQPPAVDVVLFRGATIWTCGDQGKIVNGDVLVRDGKIVDVGTQLAEVPGCRIMDARGKHITPGLIDCHSHIGTDGGVNESGQVVTAEVRIGDFIDNSDISIYRHLAGGVTTANILHGSANPIGGQSQTLKLRWGASMDGMKFVGAPAGIKFALGENVKRSPNRYPNTRMGVEQILRDQFLAARQYDAARQAWDRGDRNTLPPRRDLQLDAIVEIQRGDRWVHCHSYRQDEIVATLDVLEEFHVQIGTLQHILEGYKVADRIAKHGAMASSFADWWAYKFEVFDAIPYNGVLLHDAGVVVSFNSDDAELARHLNTEAAKATKYGGVPEEEALKFVTLNPAKQLRIDDRVGSIEVGKDADLIVWSGPPLSTTTRCEQSWIDGRQYFSLRMQQELRERDQAWKARLVQMAAGSGEPASKKDKKESVDEQDRWLRYDEFCNAGGNRGGQQ
ncbi:hypothetical protein K227x_50650 [Rubripirellula lacrimiformis]|uniref:Amidohydrolase-related domain-containing protein n=1 Tax=Rubripirellula lacrimiformis TaxID=1930273 RepID=A0A517NHN4_9BACT|nr:amidohydrolase family protein [Rubripirellula lacrimiformis]QDT06649.1 hypothetical protein K227x_50650 [Rubripirellula lacrimiformis]